MALGLALLFFAGSFGLLFFMRLWLRRQRASPREQAILSFILMVGALTGVWLSLRFDYQIAPGIRYVGAPLPLVVFRREGDQWTSYPRTRPVMAAMAMANSATVAAAMAGPWMLWFALRHRVPRPTP